MGEGGDVRGWLLEALEVGRPAEDERGDGRDGGGLSRQQREAVERGARVVESFGGVLLADAVGLGKTAIALEMARLLVRRIRRRGVSAEPPLFVVPARLRRQWERTILEVGWQPGRDAHLVSHHFLSRQGWDGRPGLVVVDEAHRFRNPGAKRSRNLARLTGRSPVILVTASPLCTSLGDLRQLLSYFLNDEGAKRLMGVGLREVFAAHEAGELDLVELLEEVVIRRGQADFGVKGRPGVRFEELYFETGADEDWLWKNLEPSLQRLSFYAAGAGWPRGLIIHNLLRLWESGAEALGRSLEELIHYHERWLEAVAAWRVVERPDFHRLFSGVDRRQQVFPFLYKERSVSECSRQVDLVRADLELLGELARRVESVQGVRSARFEAIFEELKRGGEEPYLIFTAYRAAAEGLFRALSQRAPNERVGLVTGEEAVVTGLGVVQAEEVVERFAREGAAKGAIRVMIATDCMSEGVNLQRCSRLILADLPSTPVRLEQRIGRIARPGSRVGQVQVYLLRPTRWSDSLGMGRRLGERLEVARAMGLGHQLAQAVAGGDAGEGGEGGRPGPLAAMTLEERIRGQLLRSAGGERGGPLFAQIKGEGHGAGELWVRVVISRGGRQRARWLLVLPGAQRPIVRLSEQVEGLARLADDRRLVERWEGGGRAWDVARRWVQARRELFEAARLAPALLGRGSAPVELWRVLREAVEVGEVEVEAGELEGLYQRLLGAYPAGLEVEMEEFLAGRPGAVEVRRFVEGLPEVRAQEEVEVRIVGALYGV